MFEHLLFFHAKKLPVHVVQQTSGLNTAVPRLLAIWTWQCGPLEGSRSLSILVAGPGVGVTSISPVILALQNDGLPLRAIVCGL